MLRLVKIAIITVAVGTSINPVSADERMRPLTEAFAQEDSPQMLLYVFQRCAALMMKMSHRAENDDREGADQLFKFMKAGYEAYAAESAHLINIIEKRTGDEVFKSPTEALETILKLYKIYSVELENSRLLTGNALDQQTLSDLDLCSKIMKGE